MPNIADNFGEYYAKDRATWRKWLQKHHQTADGIWLVYYKKDSGKTRVSYNDAVEEALCYGWIDSTLRPIDDLSYKQLFMPRKPKSGWSKLNKDRVEKLQKEGLMTAAGLEKIELAKTHGTWGKLDHIESFTIPPDLEKAFTTNKAAKKYYETLSTWRKKYLLYWLGNAKREETRQKRIEDIIQSLNEEKLPDHFTRLAKKKS